jgi:hypothetical protein
MPLYTTLFLFLLSSAIAQKPYSEVYYPSINLAEEAIIKSDYSLAHKHYSSAFSNVKNALARDLFNAAACKILLNDFDGAKPYLLKLAARGVPTRLLENEEVLLLAYEKWESFKPTYLQIYTLFTPTVNENIEEKVEKLKSLSPRTIRIGSLIEIKASDAPIYISSDTSTLNYRLQLKHNLIQLLEQEGGYFENQSGISDQELILDNIHTEAFKFTPRLTNFKAFSNNHFSPILADETKKYLIDGIEKGKWHRDIISKTIHLQLEDTGVKVAKYSIEEKCHDVKSGIYFKTNPSVYNASRFSFTEKKIELPLQKAIFKHSDTYFKLSNYPIIHQVLSTCSIAKNTLAEWTLVK